MNAWPTVTAMLALWSVASFACARGAERRAVGTAPRPSLLAIGAAVLVTLFAVWSRATPASGAACGFACIGLIAAADSDARTGYLFDAVTLPAAVLASFAAFAGHAGPAALGGAALLGGGFGALVLCSRGRLMGLGDVKALLAVGVAFGPYESLIAILAACLCGLSTLGLSGKLERGASLPFGPHLAAGGAFALFAGDFIQHRMMGV